MRSRVRRNVTHTSVPVIFASTHKDKTFTKDRYAPYEFVDLSTFKSILKRIPPEVVVSEIFPKLEYRQRKVLCELERYKELCRVYRDELFEGVLDVSGKEDLNDVYDNVNAEITRLFSESMKSVSSPSKHQKFKFMKYAILDAVKHTNAHLKQRRNICNDMVKSLGLRYKKPQPRFIEMTYDRILLDEENNEYYEANDRLFKIFDSYEEMNDMFRSHYDDDPELIKSIFLDSLRYNIEQVKEDIDLHKNNLFAFNVMGLRGFTAVPVLSCANYFGISNVYPYYHSARVLNNKTDAVDFVTNFSDALNEEGFIYYAYNRSRNIRLTDDGNIILSGNGWMSDTIYCGWGGWIHADCKKIENLVKSGKGGIKDNPLFNKFYLASLFTILRLNLGDPKSRHKRLTFSDFMTEDEFNEAKKLYGYEGYNGRGGIKYR